MQAQAVTISASVTAVLNDEGSVLLDLQAGRYYSLNPVGACIWQCPREGLRQPEIERNLEQKYQVEPARARADVSRFIATLVDRGLVAWT